MRSKALSFLLSLSLMFCVGFGSSLTASAATVSPDSQNEWFLLPFNEFRNVSGTFSESSGTYNAIGHTGSLNGWSNSFTCSDVGGVFPTFKSGHKYLLYLTLTASTSNSDITVNSFAIRLSGESSTVVWPVNISRTLNYFDSTFTLVQLSEYSPSVDRVLSTSSVMSLEFISTADYTNRLSWAIYALDITDNSESEVNQIIAAINDQTSDIQQSIEDQYGGDPGSSFPVEDIITQHNEKMGVLSFSSDALMQVLGLLSPDQTLSSELVFPSMSLTIEGQRNKVQLWPEYRFDLNTLKQHWPDFIGLMQSLTSALVWIFVLRYCYRVFEKYFLAGGGS